MLSKEEREYYENIIRNLKEATEILSESNK